MGVHACNSSIHETEMGDCNFDVSLAYTVRLFKLKKNQVKRIKCMYTLDKLRMAILSVSLVDFCVCAHTPVYWHQIRMQRTLVLRALLRPP